ncbi:pyridoxal-5'-phosphate-dependent protein subunit beta [Streptacidiphilus pinicola]|uniref:Pyridoxal-5'-phosphate-dependent protein subunit beta n=1 Tax=Streptacidiphilus pinicola TaxID=2219663 RepID=A0A2X0IBD3_9ACTN|nr:pyridoxal-phosphate dependent enzyme [Streptacidiphilus pinicola]RAG82244.1 pyridoxal-5'-phosphate-dependent protein subunit beta [Streptacidiphilus pinicola]
MSAITANYETLIRKIRGSAPGREKQVRFFCLLCGLEFTEPAFNRCTTCNGALDAFYDLDQVDIPTSRQGADPLQHYFDLLPVRERESLRWVGEGNTPCFEVSELAAQVGVGRLFFKDESANPSRSTKDRVASVGLSRFGELGIRELVLSSTGNTSTAYARAAGLLPGFRLHVFVGRDFVNRLNYADHPNITTHVVDGEFVAAGQVGERFAREHGHTWEGGFFNLSRREGLKLAYLEAFDAMPVEPDFVFQAVSSGMGLLGAFKGAVEYRELGRLSRLPAFMAVQQASCAPMARAWQDGAEQIAPHHVVRDPKGLAYAILRGNPTGTYPYIRDLCLQSGGQILSADEDRIRRAQQLLADSVGVRICFASATALAGVMRAAETGALSEDSVVLVNLTGGDRPVAQTPNVTTTWTVEEGAR